MTLSAGVRLDWTIGAEESSPRPQQVATHYKTSSGQKRELVVPRFVKKNKKKITCVFFVLSYFILCVN